MASRVAAFANLYNLPGATAPNIQNHSTIEKPSGQGVQRKDSVPANKRKKWRKRKLYVTSDDEAPPVKKPRQAEFGAGATTPTPQHPDIPAPEDDGKSDDVDFLFTPQPAAPIKSLSPSGSPSSVEPKYTNHPTFWVDNLLVLFQLGGIRVSNWEKENFTIDIATGDAVCVPVRVKQVDGRDLYYLDKTGITLTDFKLILHMMDHGITFTNKIPPFSVLTAALRASTTLKCTDIRTWSISCLKIIWSAPSFLQPIPNATETIALARQYCIPEIMTRAFGEKLHDAWISVAASPDVSHRGCPLVHTAGPPCISCSMSAMRETHLKLVHDSDLFERHLPDPIGGLEELMGMDEKWLQEGYCWACVHMLKMRWRSRWGEMVNELDSWFRELTDAFLGHAV
ncbi:hypothetical protein B0H10DRAFT_1987215 [Mycena sp. CBHHK59/15]|nr:hypothetical protein B0H10DRAFT_1987215 [Mycena sp. CBHHK59/15]